MIGIDIARVVVAVSVLTFAAAADLRWRRAPDACWWVAGGAGLVLLVAELLSSGGLPAERVPVLATAGVILVLSVVGYLTGLITGGADAKALASFSLLGAFELGTHLPAPLASPFPLVLTMLTNGLLVGLAVPVFLLVLNLSRADVDGLRTLVAFRTRVDRVDHGAVWPLEYFDDRGEHLVAISPRGVPLDAFEAGVFRDHGIERVWVTPKLPLLVSLWVGLVMAVLVGDPFAHLLEALVT